MMATRVSTPRITGKMQLAIAWAAMAGVALVSTSAPALAHGSSRSGSQSSAEEAAESALLSARDTLRINGVSAPRISPDGRWVLFTQTERDMESEDLGRVSQIWRVRVDGEMRRQLTRAAKGASSPRWFPQGDRIAFRSDRDAEEEPNDQVYVLYTDGGEAWAATDHEGGVQSFSISPDGTKILYTARDPETDEDKRRKKEKDDAVVVDEDFRASHIWVQDLDEASASGKGEPRRLTEGAFTVTDPQWSPDSTRVAYVARYSNNLDDGWNSDIFVADLASGDSRKLFENPGPDASPRWSPDGSTIAFSANRNTSTTTWYNKLYLIPAAGGQPEILLEDFDLNFSTPIWAPGGQDIYWSTGDGTSINLLSVQVATGETLGHVPPAGANSQFQLSPDGGRWVWVHASPSWPGDIVTAPVTDLSQPTRLTDANAWIRNEGLRLADVEAITWTNSEGQAIEGVLHKPAGFTEGVRYPLIVNPHGGPSGAVLTSFNATNQFLSGNGFLVLQPNFRGSSNYGQEFLNANRNYWGVRDYDDIMTGVDYVVGQGWADEDRMVAYGWSYGGYMTFWMSTQTDRFKVISPGAGLSNLYSMYSTTDISNYLGWFFGTPWENEEIYRRLSPIRHVKNVTAKILIMHGANDARVPPEQAVEFYRALKDLGKDVTYVSYPRQGHGIGEPRLQMDRLRRYLYTFAEAVGIEPMSEKAFEAEQAEKKEKTTNTGDGLLGDPAEVRESARERGELDAGTFGER